MIIERFFNPKVNNNNNGLYYDTKKAINHCKKYNSFIRHYSFYGNEYIKFDGKNIVWNDGSIVDKRKLPKNGNGWGRYFSKLNNRSPF